MEIIGCDVIAVRNKNGKGEAPTVDCVFCGGKRKLVMFDKDTFLRAYSMTEKTVYEDPSFYGFTDALITKEGKGGKGVIVNASRISSKVSKEGKCSILYFFCQNCDEVKE